MTSWSENAITELEALYARVPSIRCKGLCVDSCGPIDMGPAERLLIRKAGGRIPPREEAVKMLRADRNWSCPALHEGRCQVYAERPMICRIWGVTESILCPYGCLPEEAVLSRAQGFELLDAALKAGTLEKAKTAAQFEKALGSDLGQAVQIVTPPPTRDRKKSRRLRGV